MPFRSRPMSLLVTDLSWVIRWERPQSLLAPGRETPKPRPPPARACQGREPEAG